MSRSRSSWGEEVSSPRVGLFLASLVIPPSPSLLLVFIILFGVSLLLLDYRTSFFYGAHPLVMDALAEMPEAQVSRACPEFVITQTLPTRACTRKSLPVRFGNTKLLFQFFRFVLFFLLSRELRDTESLLRPRHEETFPLRHL